MSVSTSVPQLRPMIANVPNLPMSPSTGPLRMSVKQENVKREIPTEMPPLEPDYSTFRAVPQPINIPQLPRISTPQRQSPQRQQAIPQLPRAQFQPQQVQQPLTATQSSQMYPTSARLVPCNNRNDKIYCGSKCYLPDASYTRFGTPHECLLKGIGVGKSKQQQPRVNNINQ